jgi:hypothetical protein
MVDLSFESGFRLFVVETLIEYIAGINFRVCATGNDLPFGNEYARSSLNGLVGEDTNAFRQLPGFKPARRQAKADRWELAGI